MKRRATEILHQVFPGLSEEDLAELASVAELRTYPPGTILCHEGRAEEVFYVIVSGRAEVSKQIQADLRRVLHRPGPGEFFGEIALVQKGPRTATVRTIEPTTVLEIGREAFMSVLRRSASMAVRIMLQVTSRLRDADQRSIADLRRKNVELAQAYAELAAQQKLRSQFLTTVAHELRTPLTAATGYLQLVNSGAVTWEQAPQFLETAAHNLDTVIHLVNNILFLQELDLITPEFKPLAVSEVVLKAVEEVAKRATESGLTVNTHIQQKLPQVMGDAGGLSRAIGALLDNAIKFSPAGGEIGVRIQARDETVCIEISDPGVGFPMEQLDDVCRPFTRIEESGGHLFGGVGLGIPIAKQVVESHGGHIEIKSKVNKGSTFTIVLPIPEEARQ
jgi:signal transduction histidine kinase